MNESRVLSLEKISSLNGINDAPLLGVIYGSRRKESDLDLFLIYDLPVEKSIFKENYDLNQIERKNFLFKIANKDVEYTEPLLTGEYFVGNKEILKEAKEFILNSPLEKSAFDYLTKRSIETFLQSKGLYSYGKIHLFNSLALNNEDSKSIKEKVMGKNFKFNSDIINKSLSILTYSLSYLLSINRYRQGKKFVTIAEIIKNPLNEIEGNFCNLRKYFKDCSNGKSQLSFREVESHLNNTKYLLNKYT